MNREPENLKEAFEEMFEPWPLAWATLHEVSLRTGKSEKELGLRLKAYEDAGVVRVSVMVFKKGKLN